MAIFGRGGKTVNSDVCGNALESRPTGVRSVSHQQLLNLYLDLLEQTLTGAILEDVGFVPGPNNPNPIHADRYDEHARLVGIDWPSRAHTMIGLKRLRSLRVHVAQVIEDNVPGDFIETGVWRGGASIYMRALLAAHGVKDRRVWVADSFAGLPPPNPAEFPADAGDELYRIPVLSASLDEVKKNFAKYNMLDSQVEFLPGWFKDTLPRAPIEKLAILRLDGDMYESTIQALTSLYDKLSRGGFVIIDDFFIPACRQAVEDFRRQCQIVDAVRDIDGSAAFWRKTRAD
jgi:O-methyltransferase/demethyldecarbamoylnovobiocin O-methyltransferase/8-demethyl-8-(2,3-dimethoxy-alpha-L-rhamnosyl)tetracenomycin-C 4'-O-methyltransferase